ncbi:hypothetical protein V5F59_18445 [Xanthobacter autotrophicus DSM 431]
MAASQGRAGGGIVLMPKLDRAAPNVSNVAKEALEDARINA